MSVSQRKDGRWLVKYKDTTSGKWLQRTFRDEAEARRFDDEARYDAQAATPMTLGECVVAYVQAHQLADNTKRHYSYVINGSTARDGSHVEGAAEFLADKYCTRLDRRDLENVRLRLREQGNGNTSINLYVGKLNAALTWAADQDLIPANPWAKYKSVPVGKRKHLDGKLEDFRKVYVLLPEWAQWACRTCLALCLRPGPAELCALKWDAFNWDVKSVTVYMPKVQEDKVVYPPESYLAEAWDKYQKKASDFVCTGSRDEQMKYKTFCWHWAAAVKKAEISRFPPYAMRHIAASFMLAHGADLAAVAAQLGHSSITTTAGFYTHAIASAQRRSAQVNPLVQFGAEIEAQNKE